MRLNQEQKISTSDARIELARVEFQRWRADPKRQRKIPDKLWEIATDLATVIGPSRTREILSLDYKALKMRVSKLHHAETKAQFVKVAFKMSNAFDCHVEVNGRSQKVFLKMMGINAATLVEFIDQLGAT